MCRKSTWPVNEDRKLRISPCLVTCKIHTDHIWRRTIQQGDARCSWTVTLPFWRWLWPAVRAEGCWGSSRALPRHSPGCLGDWPRNGPLALRSSLDPPQLSRTDPLSALSTKTRSHLKPFIKRQVGKNVAWDALLTKQWVHHQSHVEYWIIPSCLCCCAAFLGRKALVPLMPMSIMYPWSSTLSTHPLNTYRIAK